MSSIKIGIFVVVAIQLMAQVQAGVVMNDTLRMAFLNAHNNYRSTVALGNAPNKNGTKLPRATDMYQLSWSKLVETYAVTLVNSCNWAHTYVNGTSNNLWMSWGPTYVPKTDAITKAVSSWYNELKDAGQNSLKMTGSNYNHFTQVVWAKTKEIACAINNCPKMKNFDGGAGNVYTFVACDYSPSGNYRDQLIYTPGTSSASKCPSGSTANSAKGLCKVNNAADIHA